MTIIIISRAKLEPHHELTSTHLAILKPAGIIFSTVLLSGSLALSMGWQNPTLNLFFAGGVLFALSDLVLSGTYFGVGKERPVDIISNNILYYGGQFLIAYSLLFL